MTYGSVSQLCLVTQIHIHILKIGSNCNHMHMYMYTYDTYVFLMYECVILYIHLKHHG